MKRYRVTVDFFATAEVEVEAENADDAEAEAEVMARRNSLELVRQNGWIEFEQVYSEDTEEIE